jgi:hypothetical protein
MKAERFKPPSQSIYAVHPSLVPHCRRRLGRGLGGGDVMAPMVLRHLHEAAAERPLPSTETPHCGH